jgi:ATP-dependent DNA helicase RecQ
VERSLRAGVPEEEVVAGLADLVRGVGIGPAWVTPVPSARVDELLGRLAQALASQLGVPAVALLARVEARPPQSEMANAFQQAANVRGAFRIVATPPPGAGLLLDDRRSSGWTLAMVGGQLRMAGAERVVPLVLASAF